MDFRTQDAQPSRPAAKGKQRFWRFALQPGDEQLLDKLTEAQRQIILAEGSYKELAERFNVPSGTVRSRLHRARALLVQLREERGGNLSAADDVPIN